MILVAGGDSFISGAELQDEKTLGYSLSTYPALLAKKHNMKYVCTAWPGNANNAISRMTMTKCQELLKLKNPFFVMVTWTFLHRYEFRFNYDTKQQISPWYSINSWTTETDINVINDNFSNKDKIILELFNNSIRKNKETGIIDFAKGFYKNVGDNEYYEVYTGLKEIIFMQNYLNVNHIPYIFMPADICLFEHENYIRRKDKYLSTLYEQIDWSRWFWFPPGQGPRQTNGPRGFYQWAIENKYSVGTIHPLEDAHYAAAELIKEKFNEMVKNVN